MGETEKKSTKTIDYLSRQLGAVEGKHEIIRRWKTTKDHVGCFCVCLQNNESNCHENLFLLVKMCKYICYNLKLWQNKSLCGFA